MRPIAILMLASTAIALLSASDALSETAEDFYRSKRTLELISASGAGSTYTIWARVVGRYMQEYIPGKPTIVVKAMPGGGGITAANYLYSLAPQDGTSFATISRNLPLTAFLGAEKGVRYDPRKFNWIGSVEATVRTCTILSNTGVRSVADLQRKEVVVGGTGPGSGQSFLPLVVNRLVGTKFKVVEGYKSADAIYLAIERGEVSGICGLHDSTVRHFKQQFESGAMITLFNLETKRNAALGNVPSIGEFISDPENKKIFEFIMSPTEMGRPFVAPPNVPADRMTVLKNAFARTMQDDGFRKELERLTLALTPTPGDELARLVNELYATPPSIVKKALALMPKGGFR